ncbi:MAG: hypothetical protein IJU66_09800, partial [Oscillospiraceae bacterium]|nr:hypothetical protein [Oscillospiraceae bacterium]
MTLTAEQKKLIERNAPSTATPFAGAAAQTKAQTQTSARTSAPIVNLTSEQKKLIADNAPMPVTTTTKRGSETAATTEPIGILERAVKTVVGGAQQSASGHAGAIGTYTQAAGKVSEAAAKATSNSGRLRAAERNAERSRNLAASATNAQLKAQLERKADHAERKVKALTPLAVNSAQTDAIAQNLYNTSDTLAERSAENIARAKQGTGFLGGLAVDLGAQATQMLGDRLIGGVTGLGGLVPMISRSFGQGAQEARRSGASLAQQVGYGAASAAVEGITEKMFDGVAGIYGKGAADDVVANIIDRVAKNDAAKRALTIGAAAAGESAEEFASGIVNPIIRAIYNGKTVGQNYSETQLADIGYDMLVGGLLGGIGGSVQSVRDNSQRQTARNAPPVDALARQSAAEGNLTPAQTEGVEARKTSNATAAPQAQENAAIPKETTAVNTDPAEHTAAEQTVINEYQNGVDGRFLSWINRAWAAFAGGDISAAKMKFVLGAVTDYAADAIKAESGVDVDGYQHMIDGSALRHIDARHGENGEHDTTMRNAEDIARMAYVLNNFDSCTISTDKSGNPRRSSRYMDKNNRPAPVVIFSKKVDGTYYIVEAVPDGAAKKLHIFSAYMDENNSSGGINQVLNVESSPQPTPEAPLDPVASAQSDITISQPSNAVKSEEFSTSTDVNTVPTTRTVGSAEAGFETPESQSREQRSRLADRVLAYNRARAEASGGLSREAYDEVFRYRSQTVEQMLQAADNLLYIETDGRRQF